LEYENLGISQRETEKEHLKYNEHPEKTTKSTLHLPLGFRMIMIKDDFFGVFCGVLATWTDLLVVMELGREGGRLMKDERKIVALETELTQIWWQDGEEGCRSQCRQA
jgi:hypothetical protein